jgi:hypothetical protein
MASLANLNTNKKNFKFIQQHFGTQISLWVEINLDPTVKWEGLNKINVHTIFNL